MITITNISKNYNVDIHKYKIKINEISICEFEHLTEEGLAECLRKAADSVDKNIRR